MTVLDPPHHPVVGRALDLTRDWCRGQVIDDAPALRHAVLVARTLVAHVPGALPEWVAAALLHDAPDFAPSDADLDHTLDTAVSEGVAKLVRALHFEHRHMQLRLPPRLVNQPVTLLCAADKVVAFRSLLTRARRSGNPAAFFAQRRVLRELMPYFHDWSDLAALAVPSTLAHDLRHCLFTLDLAVNGVESPTPSGAKGPLR